MTEALARFDALLYESFVAGAPLLRAALHGSLFVLLVWAICRLVPRLPAAARCWLWWLACAKLLLGVAWSAPVRLPVLPPAPSASADRRAVPVHAPLVHSADEQERAVAGLDTPPSGGPEAEAAPAHEAVPESGVDVVRLAASGAVLLWLAGVVLRAAVAVWQYATVATIVAHARPLADEGLNETNRSLSAALGLARPPRLLSTVIQTDPLAAGVRSPVVVFSEADMGRLGAGETRQVLAHELAHLRRGDLWIGLVPLAAQIVFWCFPPALLAVREYEIAREAAADADALRATRTTGSDYGRLLLKMGATAESPYYGAAALSVTSHFRQLERRLVMLQAYSHRADAHPAFRGVVATSLFAAAVGLVPWRMVPASAKLPPRANPAAAGPRNLSFEAGIAPWVRSATDKASEDFEARAVTGVARDGGGSLLIHVPSAIPGEAFVKQKFSAAAFAGKTVRFSAYFRSQDLKQYGAGLWVRVDGNGYQKAWNRQDDLVRGTQTWTKAAYTFAVPADARDIEVGVSVGGTGRVWVDDVQFAPVPAGEKVTLADPDFDSERSRKVAGPRNLDFTQGLLGWGNTANGVDDSPNPYYTVGVDLTAKRDGKPSGFLMATVEKPKGYGALRQDVTPGAFRGKRVRYSVYLKTVGTTDLASPLFAVISASETRTYSLEKTPIRGDTDWQRYEFVADVPADALQIMIGASIRGSGKIYVNDAKLEVVGSEVPVTPGAQVEKTELDIANAPTNLDFAKGLQGWGKENPEGDAPDYAIGVVAGAGRNGGTAGYLTARKERPAGYGTLLQYFLPEQFRGKRIRYSAYLKTESAASAGLWLRLDTEGIGQGGGGWNMVENPIRGTTGWKRYECVIDVPQNTLGIQFGIDLNGKGKVWVDGFKFEVVGKDVPLTPDAVVPN